MGRSHGEINTKITMFDISKYLEKFKKISMSRDFLRNSVAEAVKDACNIDIDPKKIDVKNRVARINEKPIIKSEIFMKKVKILEKLAEKTERKITEII